MKNFMYRLISVVTFILAIVCFVAITAVKGGGFIDLSNLARYALASLGAVLAIISVVISMKLKLAKRKEEKEKVKQQEK